jgi:hypothetical protein
MSVEELREAAPMRVSLTRSDERLFKRITRESSVLAYVQRYTWKGYSFELRFGFDRHARLNSVFLVADGDRFEALDTALAEIYGEPIAKASSPLPCRLWLDQARADYIRLRRNNATIIEQTSMRVEPAMGCAGAGRPIEG